MKHKSLVRALEKREYAITHSEDFHSWGARNERNCCTWFKQGDETRAVRVASNSDKDDAQSDYTAGCFTKSIKQVILWLEN